jgi:hypothetical protein
VSSNKVKLNSRSIRQAISQLEKISIADVDEEYIKKIISTMIKGYTVQAPVLLPPHTLYRARICDKPELVTELSYPPSKYIKENGRGNYPGQSMFYCSTHSFTPFYELRCQAGDNVALSSWRTKSQLVLNHIGFTEEVKRQLKSKRNIGEIYDFVTTTNNFSELNEMVHEYLGYLFSQPVKDDSNKIEYKLTSTIADIMMHSDEIHGLIYPTIQMLGNADNILLKPGFVDRHLEFVNVEFIQIKESDSDGFIVDRLDSATSSTIDNGKLSWSGRPLQFKLKENGMVATFKYMADGTWVGRDQSGKIIDPV